MAYLDEQTTRINEMYNNLKKQKLGELTSQRDQGITDFRRRLSEQLPQYQTARAQADVGQAQNINKLKEYMASSGAFNSGDNLSRAGNVLAQRGNAVNQIGANENAFTLGINNGITDANNAYDANVNSVNSQFDAQQMQDIMNLQAQIRQEQLAAAQRATSTRSSGSSGSSKTAAAQKAKDTDGVWNELYNQIDSRTAEGFLQSNRAAIIENLGSAEYNKMLKYAKDYTYSAAENKQYSQRTNNRTPVDYMG